MRSLRPNLRSTSVQSGRTLEHLSIFLVALAGLTGVLLALNYSPSPEHALDSIRYLTQLPGGKLVRGWHVYFGAALVLVICLYLFRLLVAGEYGKQSRTKWIVAVIGLLLTIGFLFTGDVLPWDQKAFWTVRIRSSYAEGLPLVGPFVKRMMLGGESEGAPTLTRFFVIHVIVLPALSVALLLAYLKSKQRTDSAAADTNDQGFIAAKIPHSYVPYQALRDLIAAGLVLGITSVIALKVGVHTEGPPDSGSPYVPRPNGIFCHCTNWQSLRSPEIMFSAVPGHGLPWRSFLRWSSVFS